MYLVERNTAEICQALDNVWEGMQSVKSRWTEPKLWLWHCESDFCVGLTGLIKSKSTPSDNDHVSISGNSSLWITWDSLPPTNQQENRDECKWMRPVLVSTGSCWHKPGHATSTCSENTSNLQRRGKKEELLTRCLENQDRLALGCLLQKCNEKKEFSTKCSSFCLVVSTPKASKVLSLKLI